MEIACILVLLAHKLKNGYYPYVFFNLFIHHHLNYIVPGCSRCPHRNRSRRILGLRKNRNLGPSLFVTLVCVFACSAFALVYLLRLCVFSFSPHLYYYKY